MTAQAFCTDCGTARVPEGKFCGTCGAPFAPTLAPTTTMLQAPRIKDNSQVFVLDTNSANRQSFRRRSYVLTILVYALFSINDLYNVTSYLPSYLYPFGALTFPHPIGTSTTTYSRLCLNIVICLYVLTWAAWVSLNGVLGGHNRDLVWRATAVGSALQVNPLGHFAIFLDGPRTQINAVRLVFFSSDYVTLAAMAGFIIIRAWGLFVTYWLIRQLAVKTMRWLFPFGYFSVGDSTGWGLGLWWATPIVLEFSGRYLL